MNGDNIIKQVQNRSVNMKTILITLTVVLCANIDVSQARFMDFSNMFSEFFRPLQNLFQTVCDANVNACIQRGSLTMSNRQSSTSTYYNMYTTAASEYENGAQMPAIEVFNRQGQKITTVYPGNYVVNGNTVRAWDLRPYTKDNFDLMATTPNDLCILTYYSGFQPSQDIEFDSFSKAE